MALTIRSADGIICTLAAAAKLNLAMNFRPVIIFLDEAACCTELKTSILYGSYAPSAFVLAADHKQIRPCVKSADQWKNTKAPYINPFQNYKTFYHKQVYKGLYTKEDKLTRGTCQETIGCTYQAGPAQR
jgi:hypothetical protein